ncbi:PAS domain-containing protein [Muricoccus vinaceus]|uniref:histidine kinase n=1 Tax=Muricoccus vinaceus TaxID=424704 RepID=A0ABV6IRY7_9PROT
MARGELGGEDEGAARPVAVVGLGVPAPALHSVLRFFSLIPPGTGAAFVILSEPAEALDLSALLKMLDGAGGPPARIPRDGDRLEPDQLPVAPVGVMATLEGGRLRLSPPEEAPGRRGTVDTFPVSLAEQQGESAVGIILATLRNAGGLGIARQVERVVERHAPAYVVVDDEYLVLNFSGRTGPYLDPSAGTASLNLLNLVHRDLRLDLRAALHRAAAERRPARVAPVRLGPDEDARRVGLTVEPLGESAEEPASFVVLFHDQRSDAAFPPEEPALDPAVLRDELVHRLESELAVTRDRLRATIEELESTNEELQSANEKLQTVNGELAHANSDLKNLLESTPIATIFLDNDLRVRNFTPSVSEAFHLIEGDLGRPITHIASRMPYPELEEDVRRVLRTLSTTEREIGLPEGGRFLVRVLPYRSVDNLVLGTVLTFLDITATTAAQAARRTAEGRARLATAAARIVIWELDVASGRFTHSDGFETAFTFLPPPSLAALLATTHRDDRARLSGALDDATGGVGAPLDIEVRILAPAGEVWVHLSGTRTGGVMLGVMQDVDERRRGEAKQFLLLAELQHRVKNILGVVRSITSRSLAGAESLQEFATRFSGRIDALGRTQSVLANRGTEGVALEALVRDELAASLGPDGRQLDISGPPILLKDRAAEVFALGVHELTTNALKHGALSLPGGRLVVRWRIVNTSGGGRLALEWREHGVRIQAGMPVRTGFGRALIERGLPYDLGAATSLDFEPGGVRCTMELPLGPRVIALDGAPARSGNGHDKAAESAPGSAPGNAGENNSP